MLVRQQWNNTCVDAGVNIDIYLGLGRNKEIKPDTSDLSSRLAYKRGAYFLILVITTFYCYLAENL